MEPRKRTSGDSLFNPNLPAGQKQQMLRTLRSRWEKLTDSDWTQVGEDKQKLLKVVQERYGYTREKSQQEVDQRLQEVMPKDLDERGKNQPPQMEVMGRAGGSRTTTGGREPNTNISSRAEPATGKMGNAGGFPDSDDN